MQDETDILAELNDRSREVFRRVVESYLESGDPVGSRTLTRTLSEKVSAATIRNVMQDLEFLGLLGSPHVSAGRVPTQLGLRLFVDGLLEVRDLDDTDRQRIDGRQQQPGCWRASRPGQHRAFGCNAGRIAGSGAQARGTDQACRVCQPRQ